MQQLFRKSYCSIFFLTLLDLYKIEMAAILEFSDQKHLLMMIRWHLVNFVEVYIENDI